jgi:hypothetical protein
MSASTRRREVSDPDAERRVRVAVAVAPPLFMTLARDADADKLDGYGLERTSGDETVRRREGIVRRSYYVQAFGGRERRVKGVAQRDADDVHNGDEEDG